MSPCYQIYYSLIIMKNTISKRDVIPQKLCKKWLVIEKCSGCLFEALCTYEKNMERVKEQEEKENNTQD